jgi:hypothetical protein
MNKTERNNGVVSEKENEQEKREGEAFWRIENRLVSLTMFIL